MNVNVCEVNRYLQAVPVAVIDSFKSLIWTKRYYGCGDFEMYIPADESLLPYLQKDNILTRDDDDTVMIIEDIDIRTDAENGDYFIIKGRSLESILMRRVFDKPCSVNRRQYINDAISVLLDYFTGDRSLLIIMGYRRIAGSVVAQFTGVSLYDAIVSVLQPLGIGFKLAYGTSLNLITLNLYQGKTVNVVFSPEFDNLINSSYTSDYTSYANYAYVAGEGEGNQRTVADVNIYGSTIPTGLNRREVYVDARDISSNEGEISSAEYEEMLQQRGLEKFAENYSIVEKFETEINPQIPFRYKVDYNLGDIVTVTNEYGVTSKPRIVEIIESWDDTGYTVVPTFEALEVEGRTLLMDSDGYVLKDSTGAIITVRE